MRNSYTPSAGTRLYYDVLGGTTFSTQLAGVKKYGTFPGGNDRKEIDITRADQVLDDETPDYVEQTAPGRIDPGAFDCIFGGDDAIDAAAELDDATTRSWKILFSSGKFIIFDGWVMKAEEAAEENGERILNFKVRATSLPVRG